MHDEEALTPTRTLPLTLILPNQAERRSSLHLPPPRYPNQARGTSSRSISSQLTLTLPLILTLALTLALKPSPKP
jgi:hypothetical protein